MTPGTPWETGRRLYSLSPKKPLGLKDREVRRGQDSKVLVRLLGYLNTLLRSTSLNVPTGESKGFSRGPRVRPSGSGRGGLPSNPTLGPITLRYPHRGLETNGRRGRKTNR